MLLPRLGDGFLMLCQMQRLMRAAPTFDSSRTAASSSFCCASRASLESLNYLVLVTHLLEYIFLFFLPLITSIYWLELHMFIFLGFIFWSWVHMFSLIYLQWRVLNRPPFGALLASLFPLAGSGAAYTQHMALKGPRESGTELLSVSHSSLRLRVLAVVANFACFAIAIVFYLTHEYYCPPFVYSFFAVFEWLTVVANIGFHCVILTELGDWRWCLMPPAIAGGANA